MLKLFDIVFIQIYTNGVFTVPITNLIVHAYTRTQYDGHICITTVAYIQTQSRIVTITLVYKHTVFAKSHMLTLTHTHTQHRIRFLLSSPFFFLSICFLFDYVLTVSLEKMKTR